MQPSSSLFAYSSHLDSLLYIEVCLLAATGGILATRFPQAGCVLFLLVWMLDFPRTGTLFRSTVLLLAFVSGYGYAFAHLPKEPEVPEWLWVASHSAPDDNGEYVPPKPVRISATVAGNILLSGNRHRIILDTVRPLADEPTIADTSAYSGKIVWNWRNPSITFTPGDRIEATVRLSPVHGFANPGVWDLDTYWHDRGVWFRAWSGGKTNPLVTPDKNSIFAPLFQARATLHQAFVNNLPQLGGSNGDTVQVSPGAAVLPALVFGDRSSLTYAQSDLFARSTLAHSLALSGLHLGFAIMGGFVLAYCLGRIWTGLFIHLPRPGCALLLSLPLASIYIWLGQAPVSLLRAASMLFFWTILAFMKRPRVLLDGLFAALVMLLLYNPLALFDLSLQLSAISVAIIGTCLPLLIHYSRRVIPGQNMLAPLLRGGFILLGTSLCIQVGILPISLTVFGTSGLLFPLNLIWLPVLGTVVLPLSFLGLFATACGLDVLARGILYLASIPCEGLLSLLEALDLYGVLLAPPMPRPHWLTSAGFWLLCLVAPSLFLSSGMKSSTQQCKEKRPCGKKRIPGIALVLFGMVLFVTPVAVVYYQSQSQSVVVRLLDVGQGQSVLIEWSGLKGNNNSGRMLIDGGGFSSGSFDVGKAVITPVLTDNALPHVDLILATHPDTDHLAGLVTILEYFRVERYAGNGDTPISGLRAQEEKALQKNHLSKETLTAGDRLMLAQDLHLEVLWPPASLQKPAESSKPAQEKGNNTSLVLRLVWRGVPLGIFCGDVEIPALTRILEKYSAAQLSAQILVLPHHGSSGSLVPGFYDAVTPQLALAACGFENRWGFPSVGVRTALKERNITLLDTARHGQIRVQWLDPQQPFQLDHHRPYN